jgi:hypothetical protein
MTDTGYYDQSYPPSILNYSTGATAGIPGTWTPAGSIPPDNLYDLSSGHWVEVVANPQTQWTTGQYMNLPDGTRATWAGTNWVGGVAPLSETTETPPEPEPESAPLFEAIPVESPPDDHPPDETSP